jgi:quinol monooxygenase YgiN
VIVEIVTARIKSGMVQDFPSAFLRARQCFAENPHCLSFRLLRGVERPDTFVFWVEWNSVEGHMTDFRNSSSYSRFRQILRPFYEHAHMEHFGVADLT